MLHGTKEEYEYHKARAEDEFAQAEKSDDTTASFAHRALANMHLTRSELVAALHESRRSRANRSNHRIDKEG